MSLPNESLLLLSAYADGELEGEEHRAAEALIEQDPEARAFVGSLSLLGDAIRAADALDAPRPIDVADGVLAELERGEAARVRGESPAREVVSGASAAPIRTLAMERQRRAKRSQMAVIVGALALAAASVLYVRARKGGEGEGAKPTVAQAGSSGAAPLAAGSEKGVEVRDIDSDEKSQVSVFYLPAGANMASSVVVWIDDKGAP